MTHPAAARRPGARDTTRGTVALAAGLVTVLMVLLVPSHLVVLTGTPRAVMVPITVASALLSAAVAVAARRRLLPDGGLEVALALVVVVPTVDSLVLTAVASDIRQTAVTMLTVVAAGAVLRVRTAAAVFVCTVLVWALLVAWGDLGPRQDVVHYAFGLAFAGALAYAVNQIRDRDERVLDAAREDLAALAAVARCGQSGADPRPVVLSVVRRLARAAGVAWVEAEGGEVVASAADGLAVQGIRMPREQAAIISRVFDGGERIFVPDTSASGGPTVNSHLVSLTGAVSLLCEPVLHDGEVLAVLVVGWTQQVNDLEDHAVTVVATLAAEAGAAVASSRLRRQLQAHATTDPMTGIDNRRGWNSHVELLGAHARRTGEPLTLALADLDQFKLYNDTYGHDAGDEVLKGFAENARGALRDADVIARWGGEEFAIAMPSCTTEQAVEALDRLRTVVPRGQTCSFGVATWRQDETYQACMTRADAALYRAKESGRDRVST